MEDNHGLNLNLTLKCPPPVHLKHTVNPLPVPPPSQLLSSLGPCPYKLIPSPYNSHPHNHPILPLATHKPSPYTGIYMDKEIASLIEEKRRQVAAAMVVKERERPAREEEVVFSSANSSTVWRRGLSGNKRSVMEREENEEADMVVSEDEDGGDGAAAAAARKKLRLSMEQAAVLEETFKGHHTLSTKQKVALARQLDLRPRQVEVWFQNRRARTKLKQTELNCRHLRRYCQTLSEENKRLQKELAELRALRLSPMNMTPPTTLRMCPQCVRATTCSSSSSSSTQPSSAGGGAANTNHPKKAYGFPFAKLIP